MSVCLKVERALQRYLLGSAQFFVAADGNYVRTDKGLKITLRSGFGFFLSVLRGQDDVEAVAPGVIAACPSAVQLEPGTLTHLAEIEITLRYPVDEGQSQRFLLDAFEYASGQLVQALYRDDLPSLISQTEDGFTCTWAPGTWTQASGWVERLRTYQLKRQIVVVPADL